MCLKGMLENIFLSSLINNNKFSLNPMKKFELYNAYDITEDDIVSMLEATIQKKSGGGHFHFKYIYSFC